MDVMGILPAARQMAGVDRWRRMPPRSAHRPPERCRWPQRAQPFSGVNAQGVGGVEGGPALFNLAACGQSSGQSGGSSTRTYCDSVGNCSSHRLWGWIGTTR